MGSDPKSRAARFIWLWLVLFVSSSAMLTVIFHRSVTAWKPSPKQSRELPMSSASMASTSDGGLEVRVHSQSHIDWECLPGDHSNLRRKIASTDNVIVVMPAKAAGTSMKFFARRCNANTIEGVQDLLRKDDGSIGKILTKTWDMPGVFVSHFWSPTLLSRLLRTVSRHTLILYSHREETSRFKSAAHHVFTQWCRHEPPKPQWSTFFQEKQDKHCNVHENKLIEALRKKPQEMGFGNAELLTCGTFKSIEEYAPEIVFTSYENANIMQNLLAEKYCPKQVNHTHHVGKSADIISVQLQSGKNVTISDWLDKKSSFLDWTLELNNRATCLAKTRRMEDELLTCDGGFLNAKAVVL